MKVWASVTATASVLGMAYLAACSSSPTDGNTYVPPAGTAGTGGAATAGAPATGTAGMVVTGTAGTDPGTAGAPTTGGAPGTAGAGTAGSGTAGSGTAGAGTAGGTGGETEIACPMMNGKLVDGHCSSGVTYPTYTGYTLSLVEDFPAALDLDKDPIMTWSDGSPQDGQTGFRKENILFSNGHMQIKAESTCPAKTTNSNCYPARMSYGEAFSPDPTKAVGTMGVWSGELRTKYNNYRYGRYEVKYKAPIANPGQEATDNMSGDYLSTMFIFRTPKNLAWNEIDVELEPFTHNHIAGNVVNAMGATGYPAGNADGWNTAGPANYAITQEHVYAFTWTPQAITWYVDGTVISSPPLAPFAGTGADPIPTLSAKIMMNLWVFSGTAFGDGVNNKFPFQSEYDYFHFYKLDTETTYPCSPVPTCLPAADKTKSSQNNPTEANYGM